MITDEPPAATAAELTPIETAKLENLEIVITNGLQSFLDVGRALLQIRDERLYRLTHTTFEAYSHERWGMTPQHANRLATAATIVESLEPIGSTPTNESQVRPLAKLPVEERGAAWQEAVTISAGKPTAAIVEKIVEKRKAPQAKAKAVEKGLVEDDDELLDDVATMLNGSVAAMNKAKPTSKAVEAKPVKAKAGKKRNWKESPPGRCPNTRGSHEWADDGIDCKHCGEPQPKDDDERLLCNMNDPRFSFVERVLDVIRLGQLPGDEAVDHDFWLELRLRFLDELKQSLDHVICAGLPYTRVSDFTDRAAGETALRLICAALDAMNATEASE